jgi:hypothetical protein
MAEVDRSDLIEKAIDELFRVNNVTEGEQTEEAKGRETHALIVFADMLFADGDAAKKPTSAIQETRVAFWTKRGKAETDVNRAFFTLVCMELHTPLPFKNTQEPTLDDIVGAIRGFVDNANTENLTTKEAVCAMQSVVTAVRLHPSLAEPWATAVAESKDALRALATVNDPPGRPTQIKKTRPGPLTVKAVLGLRECKFDTVLYGDQTTGEPVFVVHSRGGSTRSPLVCADTLASLSSPRDVFVAPRVYTAHHYVALMSHARSVIMDMANAKTKAADDATVAKQVGLVSSILRTMETGHYTQDEKNKKWARIVGGARAVLCAARTFDIEDPVNADTMRGYYSKAQGMKDRLPTAAHVAAWDLVLLLKWQTHQIAENKKCIEDVNPQSPYTIMDADTASDQVSLHTDRVDGYADAYRTAMMDSRSGLLMKMGEEGCSVSVPDTNRHPDKLKDVPGYYDLCRSDANVDKLVTRLKSWKKQTTASRAGIMKFLVAPAWWVGSEDKWLVLERTAARGAEPTNLWVLHDGTDDEVRDALKTEACAFVCPGMEDIKEISPHKEAFLDIVGDLVRECGADGKAHYPPRPHVVESETQLAWDTKSKNECPGSDLFRLAVWYHRAKAGDKNTADGIVNVGLRSHVVPMVSGQTGLLYEIYNSEHGPSSGGHEGPDGGGGSGGDDVDYDNDPLLRYLRYTLVLAVQKVVDTPLRADVESRVVEGLADAVKAGENITSDNETDSEIANDFHALILQARLLCQLITPGVQ